MSDRKTARITWRGANLDFHGALGSGYEFDLSGLAGPTGGSPMEFLLAGVAGCTAIDVVHILGKMRQQVTDFAVEINGARTDEHPKVYTEVNIVYIIRGESIDPKSVEAAIELSQGKYCSASILFQRAGVTVNTDYRIEAVQQ